MIDDPFLFFLHIPKNAGTTLRSILDCQYGRRAVLTYYNQPNRHLLDNLRYMLMDGLVAYRALAGHFSFGEHENLGKPYVYITLMRAPVQRAISGYYENLKTDPGRLTNKNGTLRSLSEDVNHRPDAYANQQLKMLAGMSNEAAAEDLEAVRRNLAEHFAMVGTIERFDESVLLMSKRLNWKPCLYGRLNPGRAVREVDDATIDALKDLNALECVLYEEVSQTLDIQIAKSGEMFHAAYAQLSDMLLAHPVVEARLEQALLPLVEEYLAQP